MFNRREFRFEHFYNPSKIVGILINFTLTLDIRKKMTVHCFTEKAAININIIKIVVLPCS